MPRKTPAHLSFHTGILQSWAPGLLGGDEGREAGDPDDMHAGFMPGLPDAGGVQEDDGEKVRKQVQVSLLHIFIA